MRELINFEGQLLSDLTPVVNRLVSESKAQGESPSGASLFLANDGVSILIKVGSQETKFVPSRPIESRGMGVVEDHFAEADGHKSDGLAWRYAENHAEKIGKVLNGAVRILSFVDGTGCPYCSMTSSIPALSREYSERRQEKARQMASHLQAAGIDPVAIKGDGGHDVLWETDQGWRWNCCCQKDEFLKQLKEILGQKLMPVSASV